MKTAVRSTSIDAYQDHEHAGRGARQRERIINLFESAPRRTWSIGEAAKALGMEKSTVSARFNELKAAHEIEERAKRPDLVSGVRVTPCGLPGAPQ